MCLNPIIRPNPNYGRRRIGLMFMKDCENKHIYVPCGHCPDCIAMRQAQIVQRCDAESRENHVFFCTLTYDNKHIPKIQVEVPVTPVRVERAREQSAVPVEVLTSRVSVSFQSSLTPDDAEALLENADFDGVPIDDITDRAQPLDPDLSPIGEYRTIDVLYADIHHVQLMMKNLRDNLLPTPLFKGRKISYLAVSERGKQNGRPHFHILFFISKLPGDSLTQKLVGLSYSGSGLTNTGIIRNLEKALYDAVFKYWSINVGTRKHPVYEPLFTYRKRYVGGMVHTNFDLHWVDPGIRNTEGTHNVVYYVTKYMMKSSEKEQKLQQFLALNFSKEQFAEIWKTIKSKMMISKGLGLNVSFETIEVPEEVSCPCPIDYMASDDLPPDFIFSEPTPIYRIRKKRLMVPDFVLAQKIRQDLVSRAGQESGPIFIDSNGKIKPLCRYYQRFSYIFTPTDAITLWFNDPDPDRPKRYEISAEERAKIDYKHAKRLCQIEAHSDFDTNASLFTMEDHNPTQYV